MEGEFVHHTEFDGCGQEAGLDVFRVENFAPVRQDVARDAKSLSLHSGDSYVILHTIERRPGVLRRDIHYWLGLESTQDERGTAALLAVELDDLFGGEPIQYREVERHESERFLKIFEDGLRYVAGGVDSGFTHVSGEVETRVWAVKAHPRFARACPVITAVPATTASFNHGDAFVVDDGKVVTVWRGRGALQRENFAAAAFADTLGRTRVTVNDGDGDEELIEKLGGRDAIAPEADEVQDEEALTVMRAKGAKFGEGAPGAVAKEDLESTEAYIFVSGVLGFVWVGRRVSKQRRRELGVLTERYLSETGAPVDITVQTVREAFEPAEFDALFTGGYKPVLGAFK